MVGIEVRREEPKDHRAVEELTREAFWDLYVPGCDEHYLVHLLREHGDFIPELDLVAEVEGRIVGNIMYTRAKLLDQEGNKVPAVSFGPVCVLPEFQRMGIGSLLIDKTIERLRSTETACVVIWGHPRNYVRHGFKNCKEYWVSILPDKFPTCLLVKELRPGVLGDRFLTYIESEAYAVDRDAAMEFDSLFPPREKRYRPSQEEFKILSRSWYE